MLPEMLPPQPEPTALNVTAALQYAGPEELGVRLGVLGGVVVAEGGTDPVGVYDALRVCVPVVDAAGVPTGERVIEGVFAGVPLAESPAAREALMEGVEAMDLEGVRPAEEVDVGVNEGVELGVGDAEV